MLKKSYFLSVCILAVFFAVGNVAGAATSINLNTQRTGAELPAIEIKGTVDNDPVTPVVRDKKEVDETTKLRVQKSYGKLPLSFIKNNGQLNNKVKYYERGSGHSTYFTDKGVCLSLTGYKPEENVKNKKDEDIYTPHSQKEDRNTDTKYTETIKLIPINANKNAKIVAEGTRKGKINYLIGNDPSKWNTNIPTYQSVTYREIYDDIDMKFYGNNSQMEYDIIVKPGASPSKVQLQYDGVEELNVNEKGELEISLKGGKVLQKKLYIYQEIDGKRINVDGQFKIINTKCTPREPKRHNYGFTVASYDKKRPLIIDPVLSYSTYLGGSSADDGYGIAVDTSGNAYVAGMTMSTDFPLLNEYQVYQYYWDVFVTKLDPNGELSYSTYLGGDSNDNSYGIAVDTSGNAYVTGQTASTNFPLLNEYQGSISVSPDAFVTKLDSNGGLSYSTYLGGDGYDMGDSIAVDSSGNSYVTGETSSGDFPLLNEYQGGQSGYDAFVTKLDSNGGLSYSTYLGGDGNDKGYGIAVDNSGNTYVIGQTYSTNFPLLNEYQGSISVSPDAFVTKLDSNGGLSYSTYLGGDGYDRGNSIAVDTSGNAYVTGVAISTDFPLLNEYQGSISVPADAFVTKLDPNGELSYSTYLGGNGQDEGWCIAVDTSGNAYVTGITMSTDFPLQNEYQGYLNGTNDIFVTKFTTDELDTDGDCLPDNVEVALGLDPSLNDTDGDGVFDGDEDYDHDGVSNCDELILLGTNLQIQDTDGDGFIDGYESARGTDPNDIASIPAVNIYVDSMASDGGDGTPGNPYNTIQTALNSPIDYDLIQLADGTYTGIGNKDLSYFGLPFMLVSENGAENCIIDCQGTGRGFAFENGEGALSILKGVTIRNGNSDNGGGIYCSNSSPTIQNCIITENNANYEGGGIFLLETESLTIQNCVIEKNNADFGAGLFFSSYNDSLSIQNCTITQNNANYEGSGAYFTNGEFFIKNTILWANTGNQIFSFGFGSVSYSLVQGGWEGEGNLDVDPMLATAGYRLRDGSPCIDAGSDEHVSITDIDGESRWDHPFIVNVISSVDIGADEFVDTDSDAMADAWELNHFWDLSHNGSEDSDNDGFMDFEEYENGTDPYDLSVSIIEPVDCGVEVIEGDQLAIRTEVSSTVDRVVFYGNNEELLIDDILPYEIDVTIPTGVSTYKIEAVGEGNYGKTAKATCELVVIPDPLTTVTGKVLDSGGASVSGATVTTNDYVSGTTSADGTFTISDVSTILGQIRVEATLVIDETLYVIRSEAFGPVTGGITDVGTITLVNADDYNEDNDCLSYTLEKALGLDPYLSDTDGDGMSDGDEDHDHDGLSNCDELNLDTNLWVQDSDGDEFIDGYEYARSTDPKDNLSTPTVNLYVDPMATGGGDGTPGNPFNTIQTALDAAQNYDLIQLADGTYTGSGNKNLIYAGKSLMLISLNGAENCIIDCEGSGRGFILENGEGVISILNGITIRNGNSDKGGGIYSRYDSVTIQNCTITGNSTNGTFAYGGGIYSSYGSLNIQNCTIMGNSVDGTHAHGGGIYSSYGSLTIQNCTVTGNSSDDTHCYGGGIYSRSSSTTIQGCTITGNSTNGTHRYGGGIYSSYGSTTIQNCTITGNSANVGYGGGICSSHGSTTIQNCTITENNGDGNYSSYSDMTINNTIFWANTGNQIDAYGVIPTVTYSLVQGGWVNGESIIDIDPQLVTNSFRLKSNSPCIDAGSDEYALATDIDVESRWDHPNIVNVISSVDIGADEFVDTDGDNMADIWEMKHFGDLSHDGSSDSDSDGFTDIEEYENGTDPNNNAPVITLSGNTPVNVEVGTAYNDAGATATDDVDGNITASIVTGGLPIDTNILGSYTVTYDVTDSSGDAAIRITRTVNVTDTEVPVITLSGSTPVNVDVGTAYNDAGATASDNVDGNITASIVTGGLPIDTSTPGSYIVTYDVTDSSGNAAVQVARTVNVTDTEVPVITLSGSTPVNVEVGTAYNDAGATASDNVDGNITASIITAGLPIDTNTPGSHIVTYDVTDSSGNTAIQVIRTVNVSDTEVPVITLSGSTPVNVEVGTAYNDAGATASDNVDGNVTASIVTTGLPIDTNTPGSHIVTYDVTDSSGNAAIQVTRTVNVTDTEVPVITLSGSTPVNVDVGTAYNDAGATANDNVDGNITASIVTGGLPIDTSTPGSYIVTYNVTDSSGNVAIQVTRTVNVTDTEVPVITLSGSTPVNVEVGAAYNDAGATASDNVDGNITASIITTGLPIDTNTPGSHIVTYDVTDSSGNAAIQVTRTVNVTDTEVPVITLSGSTPVNVEVGTAYNDASATASDNVDGNITASIVTGGLPIDTSTPGSYIVTYDVTDSSGNAAIQVTRIVNVTDTEVPVITLSGSTPVNVEVGTAYNDAGATASDNVDGNITASIATGGLPIDTSTPGSYIVTYDVTDSSGNAAVQVTRTVNVTDTSTPVTISSVDFEAGWDIWNDGGSDARRNSKDAAYANSGSYCVRLRDNTSTSVMTTDNLDLSTYSEIEVQFSYFCRSMDNSNEDFWLQISTDGGSNFITVEEWNRNDEFVNNERHNETVVISGVSLSPNTKLRFRCDASGNQDWVYIDDVNILAR